MPQYISKLYIEERTLIKDVKFLVKRIKRYKKAARLAYNLDQAYRQRTGKKTTHEYLKDKIEKFKKDLKRKRKRQLALRKKKN